LKEAGLPEELSWLPLVESGFKIKALSSARALGLWQFIPSTGYKFSLKRDRFVDERMDVEKSTEAAIAYLKELHGMFGDWTTVLAAYNCGEGRVLRVISRQHVNYLDDFWDLYRRLPYETARYVPRFLATLHIIKDPDKYGMDLSDNLEGPLTYETVETNRCMRLRDIALYLNIPVKTLKSLNPELRYEITPDRKYALKVSPGAGERFVLIAGNIPKAKAPSPAFVRHRVKRGESLSVIAEKYKSSVRAIMAYNNLKSKHRIREGQRLRIPMRGYGYFQPATKKRVRVSKILLTGKIIEYRVKQGDSLWSLARHFNTTVSEMKRINNLRSAKLGIDQTLRIKSRVAERTYTVRKGNTLAIIAKQEGVSLNSILKLNGLSRNSHIYPGQVIIVKR
jgi:FOG: LysM repeat